MQTTVWEKAGMTLLAKAVHIGMNSLANKQLIELTDGIESFVIDSEELNDGAKEIGEELALREFEHTFAMQTHGGDQQATLNLLDSVLNQCMNLTANGTVPISLIREDEINTVKERRTNLTEAVGYWQRATAFLDHEFKEGEEEPELVVRVVLHGVLFANRFKEEDRGAIKEHELKANYKIHPRFNHDALEGRNGHLSMDFDMVAVQPEPEFEEVSEEEESELNLKR